MGGMGGMEDDGPVDTEKMYNTLGVEKDASKRDIKKAYFNLAKVHHPDRGGDEEKFKDIQKAYEILGNEEKREIYDRLGEKGLERAQARPSRGRRSAPRPEDIVQTLDLTLHDVCRGPTRQVQFKIRKATKRIVCSQCDGQGSTLRMVRMGPGMVMQTQQPCPRCRGRGISYGDEKEVTVNKKLVIPKGIKNGDKIKLGCEGHSLPGMEAGDVVFNVRVAKNVQFIRQGADLALKKQLTLHEALCGFKFTIKHPSGTSLVVKSSANEIVSPGQLKKVESWGLPQKGSYDHRGHLYIKFEILFPLEKNFKPADRKEISEILSKLEFPAEEEAKLTLGIGVLVKLVNLGNGQFNGKTGKILAEESNRGRWPVELTQSGKKVAVPENCLKILHRKNKQKAAKAERAAEKKMAELEESDQEEEDVSLQTVQGTPSRTPAEATGAGYEDDDEEEGQGGVECQHM